MNEYSFSPLPFNNKDESPSASELNSEIPKDSKFKSIIKHTNNEILNFEKKKKQKKEDLLVKVKSLQESGRIGLRELNVISSGIQRVFTSMYNNLFGKGNSRGPIPKNILESSELILNNTSPGSFNMHLGLTEDNPIIESYDYDSINYFYDLMEDINSQEDYTEIADNYGIRTFNILKNWFQDLENEQVEFDLTYLDKGDKVSLSKNKISSITKTLSNIKTKEISESIQVDGKLLAADYSKLSFSISWNGKEIKGKTNAEVFNKGLTINNTYTFKLTKKIITNISTNEEKESYYLNQVIE
ncbi:hypothetical protein GCM10008983_14320 [Lentibacillus halophilus]|uniref:Uncharacterized protein n=1 Tax=Lentibacillus halophilus TaxID=295065 RepID=A0ABN0Z8I2_9BACI